MTDLRTLLLEVTPAPDDLDVADLRARVRRLQRRRRRARTAGLTLAAALVVGALALALPGRNAQEVLNPADPRPAPTSPTTPSPTPAPSTTPGPGDSPGAPAFPADTRPDTATGSGRLLAVTGVRVGRQDGYDRVVLDLAGDPAATPGWRVRYVDHPVADGSGAPLVVAGSAYLDVVVTGVAWTDPAAAQLGYRGGAVTPTGTLLVRQVVPGAVFEGEAQYVVGTTGRTPFRVFRLSDPARLVVDVRP